MSIVGFIVAVLAIITQPTPAPDLFVSTVMSGTGVVQPGTFVGMRGVASDGEILYAGALWQGGSVSLETGP